jgi:hypothetical protein
MLYALLAAVGVALYCMYGSACLPQASQENYCAEAQYNWNALISARVCLLILASRHYGLTSLPLPHPLAQGTAADVCNSCFLANDLIAIIAAIILQIAAIVALVSAVGYIITDTIGDISAIVKTAGELKCALEAFVDTLMDNLIAVIGVVGLDKSFVIALVSCIPLVGTLVELIEMAIASTAGDLVMDTPASIPGMMLIPPVGFEVFIRI